MEEERFTELVTKKKMKISGSKSVLVHRILRTINFKTSEESFESEDSGDDISYNVPDFDSISCCEYVTFENCVNIRNEDVLNYFIYTKIQSVERLKTVIDNLKR